MKKLKEQAAFTMIEMMIVLMIISILLLVAVPNMTKNNSVASSKGCEATIDLLQSQVGAYKIEENAELTDLTLLEDEKYVQRVECPDGTELELDDGIVVIKNDENPPEVDGSNDDSE
ncbi:competence type IV pilus major pilin ComGC [Desertibacillus haloalkaliphilus]|uniref:competence type IV pilus major pilin ComGC n=1 Tax=Desertibacillus haloalkaliphilus TaxID=1328930 RepID=UPI001C27966D|nr:competence type IV pilus major pilin ComGC [Desertibacillus haloalkaliphilus]MBU8908979.1 prepilin-type N-terminal cleavage/methylation domain-containing protein [Desertibacillus haloalkaliphilus]